MNVDLTKDARFWRGLLLLLGLVGLGLILWIIIDGSSGEWQGYQRAFFERQGKAGGRVEIRQQRTCSGEVDRCTSCHLGAGSEDPGLRDASVPLPHRGHPEKLAHHQHRERNIGCSACHGGSGRALRVLEAHALPGSGDKDPLMRQPHIQASCTRCHLPGGVEGSERLVAGARLYSELGCAVCHPLGEGGKGGYDYGPDLRSIGRKSLTYLETSLRQPTANFAGSSMPIFDHIFDERPEALVDLLIYLESLVLPRSPRCNQRGRSDRMVMRPCADCHAGPGGKAAGRFEHRCPFILVRKDELKCSRCHGEAVPEASDLGGGFCPRIQQERNRCSLCHEGGLGRR